MASSEILWCVMIISPAENVWQLALSDSAANRRQMPSAGCLCLQVAGEARQEFISHLAGKMIVLLPLFLLRDSNYIFDFRLFISRVWIQDLFPAFMILTRNLPRPMLTYRS